MAPACHSTPGLLFDGWLPACLMACCLQKVRCSAGTILCLDGSRIGSNGVVSGASFAVLPLDKADHRFGSSGLLGEVRPAAGPEVGADKCCLACLARVQLEHAMLCAMQQGIKVHAALLVAALCHALQDPAAAQAAEQVALLEEWIDLLKARGEVDAAAARAQASGGLNSLCFWLVLLTKLPLVWPAGLMSSCWAEYFPSAALSAPDVQAEAEAAEGECRGEVEQVEGEISELDAQLALGDMAGAGGSGGAGGAGGGSEPLRVVPFVLLMCARAKHDRSGRGLTGLLWQFPGAGGQSGRKKRGRRQQQEEEAVQEEEEQQEQPDEEGGRSAGKAKRRRMQRSRA